MKLPSLGFIAVAFFAFVFALVMVWLVTDAGRSFQRRRDTLQELYDHCRRDGRPDYECYGFVYGGRGR